MLMKEIVQSIQEQPLKRIPFSTYMGLALYHPNWGYYNRQLTKIGREGDFYTSSSVGNIYGVIWARQFIQAWNELGILPHTDRPLVILEIGGGNGDFANAVLNEIAIQYPQYYPRLQYYMCEQSSFHISLQEEKLHDHKSRMSWFRQLENIRNSGQQLPSLIFSNELFDALPVERIKCTRDGLLECWVETDGKTLSEVWMPLEREEILSFIQLNETKIPIGYELELSLYAKDLYLEMAQLIDEGYIYTVDYGWTNNELLRPERKAGTLMGYVNHQHTTDYYGKPGEIDLTSHVHFDNLVRWGTENGFVTTSYKTQREWLVQNNILDQLQAHQNPDPFNPIAKQNRAILQLITPGGMGDTFKVLTQKK